MTSAQPVQTLLIETLTRLHSAHRQQAEQLMAGTGTSSLPALKRRLRGMAKAELRQARDAARALELLHATPTDQPDQGMTGLIDANNGLVARCDARLGRDLANIAAAQTAAHAMVAQHGAARAYATTLGLKRVAALSRRTEAELAAGDRALTRLASRLLRQSRIAPGTDGSSKTAKALIGMLAVGAAGFTLLARPRPDRRDLIAARARRRLR